jgi:hypothetical protein
MRSADLHGQVALMLCENLLHVLVEEGILSNEKALATIQDVAHLTREMVEDDRSSAAAGAALGLIEEIAQSFAAKDQC